MRTRCLATALLAMAFSAQPARAQVLQEYEYQPDRIYPVRTALGITTQIELGPEETILDYSTGFSSGWDLTRRDNVFYLRPRNVDVDTNLMVRTATHAYVFELRVVATDWRALEEVRQAGVQYRIRFAYPRDAVLQAADAGTGQAGPDPAPARYEHYDYDHATRRRSRWLVPASVHDDGRFTYLRLPETPELPSGRFPAVFARDTRQGAEFVVNTSVEGDTLVVHGTHPYLVLRHGRDVVGLRRNPPR